MRELWNRKGLTTVEYGLLLALLIVAGITVWQSLGGISQDAGSAPPPTERTAPAP